MPDSTYSLDTFGIKEVADVAFYTIGDVEINSLGIPAIKEGRTPKLVFETLKMSNLEFTSETTEARGGKGNAVLLSWDHSREATMTLEDALMSADTLAALFSSDHAATKSGANATISINADGFPGEYSIVGQTFVKSTGGGNHLMHIFIPKAKVQSEASLEMSADGDPSTLNMTLKVLRVLDADTKKIGGVAKGDMVKLIIVDNGQDNEDPKIALPGVSTTN